VPAGQAVQARRGRRVGDAGVGQRALGVGGSEAGEAHHADVGTNLAQPRSGAVAPGDQHANARRQGRHEAEPQPCVQQPQALGMVDDEDRAAVVLGERAQRILQLADRPTERLPERVEEAALGRLDRPTVQRRHARPALARVADESAQQGGLAHARDPVHQRDERPIRLHEVQQHGALGVAAGQCRRPFVEQVLEVRRHPAGS
jgi:hypothetical protein